MNGKIKIVLIAAVFTGLLACSKGGAITDDGNGGGGGHVTTPSDTIPPELVITTPADNQVFASGNAVSITGRITDNNGLYRGSIRMINDADGTVIKEQAYEIHGITAYNFNISHTVSVSVTSNYTVTVWFEDHGYNSVTKSVKIKVNP
ncbi:MAG: hypothetical protein ACT4OJ_05955 [Bacteroidota bacterium]